jgi:radical SAM protein with 4Fe4S-binding SPASM domain
MKNTFPFLSKNNIFAVPAGDFWQVAPERVYLVYAPLNGQVSLAAPQSVSELELAAADETSCDESNLKILSSLKANGKLPVYYLPDTPHDLCQIDLLLNNTCNFRCTYCYSASGRSNGQVDFEKVKTLIDYLFQRKQTKPYIINFSGGGEPLLSFPLIRQTVDYIEKLAEGKTYLYNIGLVTNGSLVTPEIVEYLKRKKIDMAVSFEILQSLQDMERGSYEKVAANIDMMLDMEFLFGIRTTFTPDSVCCMTHMIEELSRRFPRIRAVVFDVVLSPDIFKTPEMLAKYYGDFIREYFAAKQRGKELGIAVESIAVETLTMLRERTCNGKIVLTPNGKISSCSRVSSPKETLYGEYIFGEIENGKISFDEDKFRSIMSENNIHSQSFCEGCFAKWNCGGGCRLFHQSFGREFLEPKCEFTRQGLQRQLYSVLCENFQKSQNKDLHAYINEKLMMEEI